MNTNFITIDNDKYQINTQANSYFATLYKLENNTYIFVGKLQIDNSATNNEIKTAIKYFENEANQYANFDDNEEENI